MPIAYYQNEKPSFTNHEIQLKKGDSYYLFSDGYSDQFGGKNNLKIGTTKFQKMLYENHQETMIMQKQILEKELKNWMHESDQTDDILVMGIRV
jgi:serine phosphatase RsbU (regulator of sigma subunit)